MNLPITKNTDQYLSYNDTADLQIIDSINPGGVTDLGTRAPTRLEGRLKERFHIPNGKEYVSEDGQLLPFDRT